MKWVYRARQVCVRWIKMPAKSTRIRDWMLNVRQLPHTIRLIQVYADRGGQTLIQITHIRIEFSLVRWQLLLNIQHKYVYYDYSGRDRTQNPSLLSFSLLEDFWYEMTKISSMSKSYEAVEWMGTVVGTKQDDSFGNCLRYWRAMCVWKIDAICPFTESLDSKLENTGCSVRAWRGLSLRWWGKYIQLVTYTSNELAYLAPSTWFSIRSLPLYMLTIHIQRAPFQRDLHRARECGWMPESGCECTCNRIKSNGPSTMNAVNTQNRELYVWCRVSMVIVDSLGVKSSARLRHVWDRLWLCVCVCACGA